MIKVKFKETMEAYCLNCNWEGKEYEVPKDDDNCPRCNSTKVFLR